MPEIKEEIHISGTAGHKDCSGDEMSEGPSKNEKGTKVEKGSGIRDKMVGHQSANVLEKEHTDHQSVCGKNYGEWGQ